MPVNSIIEHVTNADYDLALDCYYIASRYVGDAEGILYSIEPHVNVHGRPLFVSRKNGYINGFLRGQIMADGQTLRIQDLYVDGRARKCGVGKKLMAAQMEYATARGVQKIVVQSSATAIKFYERCGFTKIAANNTMTKSL